MQVTLNTLDKFQCLADKCPLTCCITWSIHVDSATLDKWAKIPDQTLRDELNNATRQDQEQGCVMKLRSDGYCVLLNDNRQCSLQLRTGHENLPQTCREYPRRSRTEDLRNTKTASMGCPAITQQLLEISDPAALFTTTGDINPVFTKLEFDAGLAIELNNVFTQVMQDQRTPLGTRLLLLSRLLISLSIHSQEQTLNWQTVKRLFNKPRQQLRDLQQLVKNKRIEPTDIQGGQFWCLVYILSKGSKGRSFLEQFGHDSFITQAESLISGQANNFSDFNKTVLKLREAALPALADLDQFGTNYLLVKCVNTGFPMQPRSGNFVATFLHAVLPYAMIQLFLWMLFDKNKSITQNDIAVATAIIERHLDHNLKIYNLFEKNPVFLQLDHYADCLTML
ncbi:MAG: flagellin lysine-N-methylase [Gammaproteobacteria bacterium]|nr:flagellin lysine-N-methylase [Gammaproteobacteria bacterium]